MGDFDDSFIEALKTQSWSLYSVGMLMIVLRIYARIKRLGILNLQVDDYLMVLAGGLYTALIVCLNVICANGGSNLYPPEMEGTFSPQEIQDRIYGSKIVVISEQAMLNVIYTMKTCMLIMYSRLTLGLNAQKAVRYIAVYVLLGWIASETAFFTACRPFPGYWGMPPPDPQCTTLENYAIVQGCFNISSDTIMLFIPLPLVLKMSMPWKQKIVLVFLFSLGFFVIIAALLTKIYNLTDVWEPTYMLWYVRESSVAVYVTNLPMIWPLLRDWFPFLRRLTPGGYSSSYSNSRSHKARITGAGTESHSKIGSQVRSHARDVLSSRRSRARHGSLESLDSAFEVEMNNFESRKAQGDDSSSTEHIVTITGDPDAGGGLPVAEDRTAGPRAFDGIKVEHTVVIENVASPTSSSNNRESDKGIFTWKRAGGAQHSANATTNPTASEPGR